MSESDPNKLKSYTDLWLVTDKQSKTVVLSWSCIFFHQKKIQTGVTLL